MDSEGVAGDCPPPSFTAMRTRTLLLLLTLLASPLAAQTGPRLLILPGSTRAAAFGGAYPIGQTESDAIFYNPAMYDRLRGASVAAQWFGSTSTLFTASAATDWWNGALGFGVAAHDSSSVAERALSVVYGRRIYKFRMSLTGKYVEQNTVDERNSTLAGDVSAATTLLPIPLGVSVQNIGRDLEYLGANVPLPLRVAIDASLPRTVNLGPFDAYAAARVAWTRDGEVVPALGLELNYFPVSGRTFTVRAGLHRAVGDEKVFTLGAGFTGDKLVLDYAFVPYEGTNSHRIGLRWR